MRRLILTHAAILVVFLLLVPPASAEWAWPVRGEVITPYRNGTDPYASGQHRGIDIAAATGTPVLAAASGEVRFAGTAGSSGLTVSVRTADGRYDTSYLHLSSTSVREGESVAAGQRLGAVGITGTRSAAAPHLHFGIRDAGSRHAYHDPLGFLPPPTAFEPPRGAPAPEPSPVPVGPSPAPAPVNAPATRRVPVRGPAPLRVPVGEPRRVPAMEPRRVPVGEPRGVPALEPGGVPALGPGGVPALDLRRAPVGEPARGPAMEPRRVPAGEPDRASAGEPRGVSAGDLGRAHALGPERPRPLGAPGDLPSGPSRQSAAENLNRLRGADSARGAHGQPDRSPTPGPGPDLGLLAACLGLLAAAAILGLKRDQSRHTGDRRKATREARSRIARALQPLLGRR
jgi:Peptidase family M23